MFRYLKLIVLVTTVLFTACKKSSDPGPATTGKTITTSSAYISFSGGAPSITGIPFSDGTKTGYLNMVPQPTGSGNASVTTAKTTMAINTTTARPSTSSGDFIEVLPLDEGDIVTIELDAPMAAPNGETYKKITITKFDLASLNVGNSQVVTMTSSSQATAGYPLAKAAVNNNASHLAGRYQVTLQ